jgi:DNA replication protein DnaC
MAVLTDVHYDKLVSFRVRAMAERLKAMMGDSQYSQYAIEDYIIDMIDAEDFARTNRKVARLNSKAGFSCASACIEGIIFLPNRSLDKSYIERLAGCSFIDRHDHIVIISETGAGKSYLSQALGNCACRRLKTVRYVRHSDMCKELNIARKTASYYEAMDGFISTELLILDDFFTTSISEQNVIDTFEIIEARVDKGSMIIASLIEPDQWHLRIKANTLADSIVDRIVHRAHFIDIKGPNMREYLANLRRQEAGDKQVHSS